MTAAEWNQILEILPNPELACSRFDWERIETQARRVEIARGWAALYRKC